MEMINLYCWGAIGAVFCLVVGAMWGYCRQERQQVHANALQRDHLQAVDAKWRELFNAAQTDAAFFESQWDIADKFRAALVQGLCDLGIWDFDKHGDNPTEMLTQLALHVATQAVDPTLSQKAKNLHTRGVRKGAAKGREQMRKFLMKSIDNQAETIQQMSNHIARKDNTICEQAIERELYREAVRITLEDKIALPGVRKSIKQAIINERERLQLVYNNQGA
jgi:hypothetical protein